MSNHDLSSGMSVFDHAKRVGSLVVREQFTAWYPLSDDQREKFALEGLVAVDTNILLDFYRMNADARQDLLSLLMRLEDRLWVPHQVGLEFHQNRFSVIHDQEEIIDTLRKAVSESEGKLRQAVNQLRDHPVIDRKAFSNTVDSAFARIGNYLNDVCKEPILSIEAARGGDPVLDAITRLLDGRVGNPYDADRMNQLAAEGKKRIQEKRPPGYADAKKDDNKKIGDYILWRQLMDEAKDRQLPVLLITNDQKEDWYRRLHGITIGPRVELIEEMKQEAEVPFHAQTLARFIQVASPGLKSQIKEGTVSEVNRLDNERRATSDAQRIFDETRRSQLHLGSSIAPRAKSEPEVGRLEAIRDGAMRTVAMLEAELLEAYREEEEARASHEAEDPRSYVRALEVQLENAQASLAKIDARLQNSKKASLQD